MPTNAINDTGVKYVYDKLDAKKVDKETGKGLSTNDYTTTDKNKVATISNKADKVSSATNGNLAGLNASGNLTDSGWNGAKDTTNISGNPISISGLKSNQLAVNPIITLEPIQDLHGQSKPYPAGGGKNKLLLSTQSGTYGDVVTTVNSDGTILCNGTASAEVNITLYNGTLPSGTYRINGNPSGASSTTYRMRYRVNSGSWNYISSETSDPDVTLASTDTLELRILIASGVQISNKLWKPMIRLATETDSSFAPYENICPISGYDKIEVLSASKNIWGEDWEVGSINNTTGQNESDATNIRQKDYTVVKPNQAYFLRCATKTLRLYWYDVNHDFISTDTASTVGTSKTSPANAKYLRVRTTDSYGSTYGNNITVAEGSHSVDYQPSVKTTDLSESLGQTVYGGTLDVRTGVLTVDMAIVDMGDLTWGVSGSGTFHTGEIANSTKLVSSCYAFNDDSRITNNGNAELYLNNNEIAYRHGTNDRIYVKNTSYSVATAFKNAMVGQKIVYELATPFTIQLTPHEISLLKDYAYVSINGTSIALDYHNGELASLGDVAQLNESVENKFDNLLKLKHLKIYYTWGTVASGTRYTYCITDDYPNINRDTVAGISIACVGGSQSMDYEGKLVYNYGVSSPKKIYIQYIANVSQANAKNYIDILYIE